MRDYLKHIWKGKVSEMDTLKFSLKLNEALVDIDGRQFKLKELVADERDAYLTKQSKRVNFVNGKVEGFKNYVGIEADLLTLCLYDDAGNLVVAAEIQRWPSSVVSALNKAAEELSGLNKKAVVEAKND